jgi:hypothetical protein
MDRKYNHLHGFLTPRDVARKLKITAKRVRTLAKARHIGHQTATGYWWFREDEIESLQPDREAG